MNSIPSQPADSRWTTEQWQAIHAGGDHVLVAAAAGSGKTAVLVQRIIHIITSQHHPIDVDRLLVATFTKAAADEMRHRIRDALERELIEHPDSIHLRKQLALIHQSSITTLHSFCLSVVQRYYHLVPLDPGFRIANEIEAELLRQDVMEDLFEQFYSESDPDNPFWGLLDRFGGERSDAALYSLIQRMYDFSRSHPFPEEWLKHHAQLFRDFDGEGDLWTSGILADVQLELEGIVGVLEEALSIARLPGGPTPYIDSIHEEWSSLSLLCDTSEGNSWQNMFEMLQTISFGKLKPCKSSEVDKDLQEQVKSLRDQAKKQLQDIKDQLFTRTLDEYKAELMESAPLMDMLVELILTFSARYTAAKADKRLVDFSDLEHFCLKILCDGRSEDGQLVPAPPALEYRDHFVEVLLDEYQDTNQVQEAILLLISRADPGNRFMVGDVKQSIYRFRLADPGIFMSKYKTYRAEATGIAIDLARNFRSRNGIVDGVNFVFRQIMQERVAEIDYDRQAELVYGANYPDSNNGAEASAIDVYLLRRTDEAAEEDPEQSILQDEVDNPKEEAFELETAELEARFISLKIKELLGSEGKPFYMTDKDTGNPRAVTYRDIVILLRATRQWAPILVEQLRLAGIPAYAELSGGYFEATEVDVMVSLLKVIDNPYQDIPISGVLRSPLVDLTAEQLACIRLQDKSAPFYEAVLQFAQLEVTPDADLQVKLLAFLQQLEIWRTESRQGDLSELLWRIYRTTGYYDYIGGLPGGTQRQANLKALYDRARQFESTSLRGLFRFLRFIKRMQDNGGDLGAAKVMGEQEDVVRIMSIHKSKGLEFPIVFVAGMSKQFNLKDMQGDFQMHKDLGFAPKIVDPVLRTSYPSLPYLAIRRRSRLESLAEEMRILYVALTRAREKLILLGSTRNPERILSKWSASLKQRELALPTYMLTQAKTYLDWIGPAVIRHPSLSYIRDEWALGDTLFMDAHQEPSRWTMNVVPLSEMMAWQEAAVTRLMEDSARLEAVAEFEPVQAYSSSSMLILPSVQADAVMREQAIQERLEWQYRYTQATTYYSKTTVTELKRLMEQAVSGLADEEVDITAGTSVSSAESAYRYQAALLRRPKFMEHQGMNAAERGTVYHSVMQHIPLISTTVDVELVEQTLLHLVKQQVIREEQREVIRPEIISEFFQTDMGQRLLGSAHVQREVPFSYGMPVVELHPDAAREVGCEIVLIQGVIDCLFEEKDGLVLLDFKTDAVRGNPSVVAERYRIQIELYAKAIEAITSKRVKEKALYFFDGSHLISM
ncbi:MAG: helicase-exonuclease AddAB subunit AddA [Paenibacillaceae bacterium]